MGQETIYFVGIAAILSLVAIGFVLPVLWIVAVVAAVVFGLYIFYGSRRVSKLSSDDGSGL
jgi:uncharacterized membrane protein